jgi:hypothetical protein
MKRILVIAIAMVLLGAATGFAQATNGAAAPSQPAAGATAPAAQPKTPPDLSFAQAAKTNPWGVRFGVAAFIVVGIAIIVLGSTTDILRDSQPQDFGGATPGGNKRYRRTFSLAQSQMAWWFCIILASYLYIICASPNAPDFPNLMDPSVLVLLGIGGGTALGGAVIDQVKGNQASANQAAGAPPVTNLDTFNADVSQLNASVAAAAAAQAAANAAAAANPQNAVLVANTAAAVTAANAAVAQLTAQVNQLAPKVASTNFFDDILTDVNGISLHRFQNVVWTLVLGVIFVADAVMHTTMPEFDATLLALLGISNGVYLGLKVPETPS